MISTNPGVLTTRRCALLALVGTGVFTAIVLLAHVIRPEFDIMTRFISEYAVTDPVIAGIAGVALGLGSIALVKAMTTALPREHRSRVGTLLLWIFGVCIVGVGLFPADEFPTINPPSWHGIIHAILAVIGFFCFSVGALIVSWRLRLMPWGKKAAPLLTVLAALCLVFFFIFYAGLSIVGLIQRIYAVLILSWIALFARTLMHHTNHA